MTTKLVVPAEGEAITFGSDGKINVPANPIIPHIIGDGIGPDISTAMRKVLDAAIEKASGGDRKIAWMDIYAGEMAGERYDGNFLPQETLDAIKEYTIAIKGPLTTPVGGGFRSLNVALRQLLDLYACVRPVRWFEGVPAPVKHPDKLDVVIFRENTEDIYAGIEFREGTDDAKKVIDFLKNEFGHDIRPDSGIGVKPVSITGTKRLVRMAIQYAIDQGRDQVTLVHKGNIMKFTEGAFRDWGYEVATEEFRDQIITEEELWDKYDGKRPEGKILINDRIADAMFQQLLLRPDEYSVLATLNLERP